MIKRELQDEINRLNKLLNLAHQDYEDVLDSLEKFEHRHILVKVMREGSTVMDAFVIPPSGRATVGITIDDFAELDIDVWTEPIE